MNICTILVLLSYLLIEGEDVEENGTVAHLVLGCHCVEYCFSVFS